MASVESRSDPVGRRPPSRRRRSRSLRRRFLRRFPARHLRKLGFFGLLVVASVAAGYMVSRCEVTSETVPILN